MGLCLAFQFAAAQPGIVDQARVTDALKAVEQAAMALDATTTPDRPHGVVVTFATGAAVRVEATPSTTELNQVVLRLRGAEAIGGATVARFRATLLTALRERDPSTAQVQG